MTQEQADEKAKAALLPFGEPRLVHGRERSWCVPVSETPDSLVNMFSLSLVYTGEGRLPWCATFDLLEDGYGATPTSAIKAAVKNSLMQARSDLLLAESAMRLVNPRPGR